MNMKKLFAVVLCSGLIISLCECSSENNINISSTSAVYAQPTLLNMSVTNSKLPTAAMFDALSLPTEISYHRISPEEDYELIIKDVVFRDMTEDEKAISYEKDDILAIVRYSTRAITPDATDDLYLLNNFSFTIGQKTENRQALFSLDESEYMTEEYSDGYYQGYSLLVTTREFANSRYTQLRFFAEGSDIAEYFDIR